MGAGVVPKSTCTPARDVGRGPTGRAVGDHEPWMSGRDAVAVNRDDAAWTHSRVAADGAAYICSRTTGGRHHGEIEGSAKPGQWRSPQPGRWSAGRDRGGSPALLPVCGAEAPASRNRWRREGHRRSRHQGSSAVADFNNQGLGELLALERGLRVSVDRVILRTTG